LNLFEKDYSICANDDETKALEDELAFEKKSGIKTPKDSPRFSHPNAEIRNFLWQATSIFPNNFLNPIPVKQMDHQKEAKMFRKMLNLSTRENDIQKYIKDQKKWFIPGSILKDYYTGNHGGYLFPEQPLGSEYSVDYMLLGKNSDGYSLILVEFENANTPFIIKSQVLESDDVRKGITQIRDWKRWMDENRQYFLKSTDLYNKGIDIPTARIYYCLVVSRRKFMNDSARELRSQLTYEANNLKIITYDRLVDHITQLIYGY